MLLQLGMLTQQNNELVLTEQTINSLDVETGDGSQVVFELVEEDEQEEVLVSIQQTSYTNIAFYQTNKNKVDIC